MIPKNTDLDSYIRFALKLLARRDHFSGEIKNRLKEKGALENDIVMVMEYLNKYKYVNDFITLEKYVSEMVRKGKGVNYLKKKLYEKGCRELFKDLEIIYTPSIEENAAEKVCLKLKNEETAAIRKKLNSFGFSSQTISRVLKKLKKESTDEYCYDL